MTKVDFSQPGTLEVSISGIDFEVIVYQHDGHYYGLAVINGGDRIVDVGPRKTAETTWAKTLGELNFWVAGHKGRRP